MFPPPTRLNCFVVSPPTPSFDLQARGTAIAIIVIHVLVILVLGWWSWASWLAGLIAWIMGGVQLCMFNKCCYITAGCLYIVGGILDIFMVAVW